MVSKQPAALPARTNTAVWDRLVRNGLSDQAIADRFHVTRQAVNKNGGTREARTRLGRVTPDRSSKYVPEWIPWSPVRQDPHARHPIYRRLVLHARQASGQTLGAIERACVNKFLREIVDVPYPSPHVGSGPAVVTYDYNDPEGFSLVPAIEGLEYVVESDGTVRMLDLVRRPGVTYPSGYVPRGLITAVRNHG